MRSAPTANEQRIVEEEKAEISGMFIEPVLNQHKKGQFQRAPCAVWAK